MSPKMIEAMNLFREQDQRYTLEMRRLNLGRQVGVLCGGIGQPALLEYCDRIPGSQVARSVRLTDAGRDWLRRHDRAGNPR